MTAPINVEVTAQVADAVRGLSGVNGQFDLMKQANRDAAGALGVFGVSLTSLNSPLTAIASGIKDSIDTTVKWGETIDKLSRSTGQSAEETSKMAVVLGDFGISADSLDKVIKTFTKNGLQFNLETLKDLAKQYQAIQDPVARDKFAFDNFGRSALDMTEILSKTPAELQAVGDAAQYSGKIMSEQGVESAQAFGVKVAQLNDDLDGLKIAIGGPLISGLTSAIDGFRGVTGVANLMGIVIQKNLGIISADQAAARADAAAHGDLFAEFHNVTQAAVEYGPPLSKMVDSHVALAGTVNGSAVAYEGFTPMVNNLTDAQIKAAAATDAATLAAHQNLEQLALNAGLSGTVTKAVDDYKSAIAGNQVEIDKLNKEIAKYTGLQGDTITINTKATTTQNEYDLAVVKAATATQKLAEYTGDDATKKLELAVAADKANESVVKLGEGMGVARDVTLDYTTKIAADKDALNELNAKNGEAAAAIAKTTGQFIYQQEVALIKDPAVLLEVAHRLGLVDDASYNLALQVQEATKRWDLNKNGMIDAGTEADGLAGNVHNLQLGVEGSAGALPHLQEQVQVAGGDLHHAGEDAYFMAGGINAIPTSHTTDLYVNHHETTLSGNGNPNDHGAGAAGGADFTVPPGYPNDSYPLRVQSGEHVVVTPAPVTNNYNTYNSVSASYGGSTGPGAIASELKLMSRLNK